MDNSTHNRSEVLQYTCDEVTDQSRQHQLGISTRWVDEMFFVYEDFLELYLIPEGDAATLTTMILDALVRYHAATNY